MEKNHDNSNSVYGKSIQSDIVLPALGGNDTSKHASQASTIEDLGIGPDDQSLHDSWMFGDRWA
ncbi:hypothetical protein BDV34DRAFT_206334 [Aspergillus parasiticus]|uniref:Uncharacterized protein n=2 Tax=Aspergillus subgen. Circumdati TaxID=2720871 RepID=A0A5N6D3A1_ASPPA|nr:hypothetical protein BDV34DRAFT_206334 [Aspergillus parasiticus]KAE8307445.1 hypothetical protein BDV41DRAFT_554851 [Aspergillus transmontanensis]